MTEPYYTDGQVTLYLGDCREILPTLDLHADLIVTDPPYGETSLKWDRWVDGWPTLAAQHAKSMWCFGSMRMFGEHWTEFTCADWRMSQDVVWEKNTSTGVFNDRFRRIHENATHWYRDAQWSDIYHDAQRVAGRGGWSDRSREVGDVVNRNRPSGSHLGVLGKKPWIEDGKRLPVSIVRAKNLRGLAIHPTEKPVPLLRPLIEYACPPRGLILDLFAGSGSTLHTARLTGRRAIGFEDHEPYAEAAARRLSQGVLDLEPDGDAA